MDTRKAAGRDFLLGYLPIDQTGTLILTADRHRWGSPFPVTPKPRTSPVDLGAGVGFEDERSNVLFHG